VFTLVVECITLKISYEERTIIYSSLE